MKKIFTLSLLFSLCFGMTNGQTRLYFQNFDTSYADWSLNTTDLGGDNSLSDNQWIVTNIYTGGTCLASVPNTAAEPTGIVGAPASNYLHIFSAACGIENCNYDAGSGGPTFFAKQTSTINTTGYTGVQLSFWWLCRGDAHGYGKVYYSTDGGSTWNAITSPVGTFSLTTTWGKDSVSLPAFDGVASLQFGFQFTTNSILTGTDPAFAIDDIKVIGTSGGSVPAAAFTSSSPSVCQDSCITLTNTSTGTVDSFRFRIPGATPATTTTSPASVCFNTPGTFTVHLYAYNSSGVDSTSSTITVNPAPHPAVTQTGNTLSVSGSYTSYQWVEGGTNISGATNSTYTITGSGSYQVIVDSGGCAGESVATTFYDVYVQEITGKNIQYFITEASSSAVLNATKPIEDNLDVTIFDATGRSVYHDTWMHGAMNLSLNTTDFSPGLYIIKIKNATTSSVLKWLKP